MGEGAFQDAGGASVAEKLTGNGDLLSVLSAESVGGGDTSSGMLMVSDLSSGLFGVLGVLGV